MINRNVFSQSLVSFPGTWRPLLSMAFFLVLLGAAILIFSKLLTIILSLLCFFGAFSLFRAALRAYLNEKNQRSDIIEIL